MKRLLTLIALTLFVAVTLAPAQTIGSLTTGSAAITPGGYVSLYATNVTSGGGAIAGVRFYRESNSTSGLQSGGDAYLGMGVFANGMWTLAVSTTGLSGSQTFYAVAYDTAGNASSVASVTASLSASGFSNWSSLQPFMAMLPLSVGAISSTPVVNNGTTIYTGPLDTTITLDRIRGDNGPNRSGDGAAFSNNGSPPLPTNRGSFYEFTINPQTGCTPNWTTSQIAFPGPIRFMIDTSGDIYFTGDHYSTDLNLYLAGTPLVGPVTANPSSTTAGTVVTLTASNVSETISPAPNLNANTGTNVPATVSNVQFYLETNGVAGLQTDTDRLLGCGIQNGSTWTLANVTTAGLVAGTYTIYAAGVDPAGNTSTQTTTLTITSTAGNQPPAVTTLAAGNITTNSAALNGSVNPNNQTATAQFFYGLTTNYTFIAVVNGTFSGGSVQAVSATITNLTPGTTYHFAAWATNVSGSVTGLDNTFTTASIILSAPAVTTTSASGVTTNAATLNATVTPNNQSTLAQFLYGLTTNYTFTTTVAGTLSGASAQAVTASITGLTSATTYHYVITATNTSGSVTGLDQSFTTASLSSGGGGTNYSGILAAWEVTGLSGYGPSPFAPATNAPGLGILGLTRGSGVGTANTAAGSTWGGTGFVYADEATAITGNSFATFIVSNSTSATLTITNIAAYNIRRSSSGSTTGIWQYSAGNGAFTDIGSAITWGSITTSTGNTEPAIDLSGISALQNVPAGTNVTFRIVLWGGTGTGTWYINNITTGYDLILSGNILYPASTMTPTPPILLWRQQWFGTTNNSGSAADTYVVSSDGMPNLLKYALGLNPLVPATNPITGDTTSGFLRLTVPRNMNATDITYLIESVGDLMAAWNTNNVVIDTNTPMLISGHDTNAISTTSRGFIRLHVTDP